MDGEHADEQHTEADDAFVVLPACGLIFEGDRRYAGTVCERPRDGHEDHEGRLPNGARLSWSWSGCAYPEDCGISSDGECDCVSYGERPDPSGAAA